MTDSASPDKEHNLETTIGNFLGTFIYKAEQLILCQTFEQPLEMDTFQIWGSPLGHELSSLYISQLGMIFTSGKQLVPKEVVVLVAKEYLELLRSEMSKPNDFDAMFSPLCQERQKYRKEQIHQAQESGFLEPMLKSFCLFLDNIVNRAYVATNDMYLSSQEKMIISLYLMVGFQLANMLIIVVSSSDEDRLRIQSYQKPEYEAAVEYVMGLYDWGGDRSKAIKLAQDRLGPKIERKRRQKELRIPGPRHQIPDSLDEPHNDEYQVILIGLDKGLRWVARQNLMNILRDVQTGKLGNVLVTIAINNLIDAIREEMRQRGIGVIPDWLKNGMDKNEAETLKWAPKEVADYETQTSHDEPSSALEMAADRESFKHWKDEEAAAKKRAFIWDRIESSLKEVRLTSKQRLVIERYFRDEKRDEEIAIELKERFEPKLS